MRNKTQGNRSFLHGFLVLTFSAVLVKLLGLFYKIPLLGLLGTEGMGYFSCAYEIYALFCVIATAGLPVALSVLIAEQASVGKEEQVQEIYRVAFALFAGIGVAGALLLFLFADAVAAFLKNPGAADSIRAISPSVFLICLEGAMRGYFQGRERMGPTAVSQVCEAVGKLFFGVALAGIIKNGGGSVPMASAGAVMGLNIGSLLGVVSLCLFRWRGEERGKSHTVRLFSKNQKNRSILNRLCRIALPVTLSSGVLSITRLLDMTLILRRLQDAGYDGGGANALYGAYTTLALPLFALVPTLVGAIGMSITPQISAAIAAGDLESEEETCRNALSLTVFLATPCAMGMALYAKEILSLLFRSDREAVEMAAPALTLLAISVVSSCLITTTNAILQASGQAAVSFWSIAAGSIVKVILTYRLLTSPLHLLGAPVGTFACAGIAVAINLWQISKSRPWRPKLHALFLPPLLLSSASLLPSLALYAYLLQKNLSESLSLIAAIMLCGILYLALSLFSGVKIPDSVTNCVPFLKKMKKNRYFLYKNQ